MVDQGVCVCVCVCVCCFVKTIGQGPRESKERRLAWNDDGIRKGGSLGGEESVARLQACLHDHRVQEGRRLLVISEERVRTELAGGLLLLRKADALALEHM